MLKSFVAAFAAVLVFTSTAAAPGNAPLQAAPQALPAAQAQAAPAASVTLSHEPSHAATAFREAIGSTASHSHDHDRPSLAPGQSKADYLAWLASSPANVEKVRAFRDHLAARQLEDVVPVWQLIRTSSSWRECGAGRFEVAPADKWDNIVTTLAFVR